MTEHRCQYALDSDPGDPTYFDKSATPKAKCGRAATESIRVQDSLFGQKTTETVWLCSEHHAIWNENA
jgi:hypothetical protein